MAGFSVTITAVDQVTKTLDNINRKMQAFTAPLDRATAAASKFGEVSGLNRMAAAFGNVGRSAIDASRALALVITPLGVLTSAASVAGVYRLVTAWSDMGFKLGTSAQRIGIASRDLHSLQGAAQLAGASTGALTSGLQALGQNMYDAVGGRAPEAVQMFATLGIAFKDAAGRARTVTEVMPQVADKIASVRDPMVQARIATALFGGAAEELLPFLRRGSAGIREYTDMAQRYGVMNEAGVAAAGRMRQAQTQLSLSVNGLANSIAEKLAPVIAPLLTQFADWIAANREWIATGIGDAVKRFADFLRDIDWKAIGTGIHNFAVAADGVAQSLGGWTEATKLLFELWLGAKFLAVMANVGLFLVQMRAGLATAQTASGAAAGVGGAAAVGGAATGAAAAAGTALQGARVGPLATLAAGFMGEQWLLSLFGIDPAKYEANRRDIQERGRQQLFGGLLTNRMGAGSNRLQQFTADTTMPAEARGLLDTIAGTESPGYDVLYGNGRFSDMSKHPNVAVPIRTGPNAGKTSSAAGRYQFIKGTWDEAAKALGLTDFSPQSQDRAAWWLAQRDYGLRTGRQLSEDLRSNDPAVRAGIGNALHDTWTSLPGGIEAGTTTPRFLSQLEANTGRQRDLLPQATGAAGTLAGDGTATAGGALRVQVDVNHNGPAGSSTAVQTSGPGMDIAEPRVERSNLLTNQP